RLGFLVAPPSFVDAFAAGRSGDTAPASALQQAALAAFIADGHFARHLRRMRVAYRERKEALLAALPADCAGVLTPRATGTGMQLTAMLKGSPSDTEIRDRAARGGVEVAALSDYFMGQPRESGLVFGFGAIRPRAMRAGTRVLAAAFEAARKGAAR